VTTTTTLLPIPQKQRGNDAITHDLHVGDWVEVRSKEEILQTLDKDGRLEGLPFMPEMFAYCGQRFRVYKRAHKTCDTVYEYKARRMKDAVHLEGLRCNGQAHGGCEASCLIFWKNVWLRGLDPAELEQQGISKKSEDEPAQTAATGCTEADVLAATLNHSAPAGQTAYVCQATQVPAATRFMPWWEWRQYVEDYTSGNVDLTRMAKTFAYMIFRHGFVNLGIGLGRPLMWLFDRFQGLRAGTPYPHRGGKLPDGAKTPTATLDLKPGEWVRVKDLEAIRETTDEDYRNRGMKFDAEMVPYCGGTYQVLKRVTRILNEKTGVMQELKNPCLILDTVVCEARYSPCRPFCPRSIYPYWREIWLQRVEPKTGGKEPDTPR
jgi:hypothetical protein